MNIVRGLNKLMFKWRSPHYDQYMSIYKSPSNPKIVVYGAYNRLFTQLLEKNLAGYKNINVEDIKSQHSGNNNEVVDQVAQSIVGIGEDFKDAYFLKDYPQNIEDAARLDSLLDGINLAVHIQIPENAQSELKGKYLECKTCGQVFNTGLESTYPHLPGTSERCNTPTRCDIVESSADLTTGVQEYNGNYQPVLDYYGKRGLLLNFVVDEKWTFQETIDKLRDQILGHIKL